MTDDSADRPELRQIVLLTADLAAALDTARQSFRVPAGTSDPVGMAAIGFRHEVFGFDRTYVEICEPIDPQSSAGHRAASGGGGFMVVVQVPDAAAMQARAADLGLRPLLTEEFHGSPISQWHPRDFGTIAEFDQMIPPDSWHLAPDVYASRSTEVVSDIVAVRIAVADPSVMAQRWAAVTGGALQADGATVDLGGRTVGFVPRAEGTPDMAVDCAATDRASQGTVIRLCGVDFRLI
jgi:hypothetical protein